MCSMVILRLGNATTSGRMISSMKIGSRSKMSECVTSEWMHSTMPRCSISRRASWQFFTSVTPWSLFVVAPAG